MRAYGADSLWERIREEGDGEGREKETEIDFKTEMENFFLEDMNKRPIISDNASTANQSNNYIKIQLSEPDLLVLLIGI